MDYLRAAGAGFGGGAAAASVMAFARAAGVDIDTEMLLASIFATPSATTWTVGLVLELALCSGIGLFYGGVLEGARRPIAFARGLLVAVLHYAVLGLALGILPSFHPRVPNEIPAPGRFLTHGGIVAAIVFAISVIVYALVTTWIYTRPVEHRRALHDTVYS